MKHVSKLSDDEISELRVERYRCIIHAFIKAGGGIADADHVRQDLDLLQDIWVEEGKRAERKYAEWVRSEVERKSKDKPE